MISTIAIQDIVDYKHITNDTTTPTITQGPTASVQDGEVSHHPTKSHRIGPLERQQCQRTEIGRAHV